MKGTRSRWTTAFNLATNVNGVQTKMVGQLSGPFNTASMIAPRLYLSGYRSARNVEELKKNGITHVISIIDIDPDIPDCILPENRLHINLVDHETADLLAHLPVTTEFIIQALKENETNKVLVHCMMGISRSATVVCAYIVATEKMLAHDAIEHVRTKRDIVCPNIGFRRQLETYSKTYITIRQCSRISPGIMGRIRSFKEGASKVVVPSP